MQIIECKDCRGTGFKALYRHDQFSINGVSISVADDIYHCPECEGDGEIEKL